MMNNHEFYMRLAIQNVKAMKGQTDPNPLVGSVIVNENRIVGIGVHMKAGEPHAEIHVIRMAGELTREATIYVTLFVALYITILHMQKPAPVRYWYWAAIFFSKNM